MAVLPLAIGRFAGMRGKPLLGRAVHDPVLRNLKFLRVWFFVHGCGRSFGGVVRAAGRAADCKPVHLSFVGVHQDTATVAAGVVHRVRASDQSRRRFKDASHARSHDNFKRSFLTHSHVATL